VASYMGLNDLLQTFQRRGMAAEIWSNASNASLMQYDKLSNNVWDATLSNLNPESSELLDFLSFLNLDRVLLPILKSLKKRKSECLAVRVCFVFYSRCSSSTSQPLRSDKEGCKKRLNCPSIMTSKPAYYPISRRRQSIHLLPILEQAIIGQTFR
jgi:hypothetical protein